MPHVVNITLYNWEASEDTCCYEFHQQRVFLFSTVYFSAKIEMLILVVLFVFKKTKRSGRFPYVSLVEVSLHV